MIKILHILGYLILFLCNLVVLAFFHSYMNFIFAFAMLILPVIFGMMAKYLAANLRIDVEVPESIIPKGTEFLVSIKIHNATWVNSLNAFLTIELSNTFLQEGNSHKLNIPIQRNGETMLSYPLISAYCGIVELHIDFIEVLDLFGFTKWKKPVGLRREIVILPDENKYEIQDVNSFINGMSEVEESNQKGSDFSEVHEIREYIPGDKMQNIHWKLSVKKDELMVKERVTLTSNQLLVLVELFNDENMALDFIMDTCYGCSLFFIQNGIPFTLYWWSVKEQDMKVYPIEHKDTLHEVIETLFYESSYQEEDLGKNSFEILYPMNDSYLRIGLGGYEMQVQ